MNRKYKLRINQSFVRVLTIVCTWCATYTKFAGNNILSFNLITQYRRVLLRSQMEVPLENVMLHPREIRRCHTDNATIMFGL
jgi:hypothetical protein